MINHTIPRTGHERLIAQVPLLAVLATQTEGEFIIRDIDALRRSEEGYDLVAHLLALLRLIGAKVGEYPEGLVIDGGHPLQGASIDSKGDPGTVQAFAVAGLLASGEMEIGGVECLDGVFPDRNRSQNVLNVVLVCKSNCPLLRRFAQLLLSFEIGLF